jgi:hypothetical protein
VYPFRDFCVKRVLNFYSELWHVGRYYYDRGAVMWGECGRGYVVSNVGGEGIAVVSL